MDEAELNSMLPPKEENPLLKRKPLNLGNRFNLLSSIDQIVQLENPLVQPHLTLLFFAAQWCNISKAFLPALKAFYQEVNLQNKKIEIIYVGFDKVKKDYENFTKTMPWLGLSFSDERVAGLKEFYDIRGLPRLVLLDNRGQQVINDCRTDVYQMEEDKAYDKWFQLKNKQEKAYFYEEKQEE